MNASVPCPPSGVTPAESARGTSRGVGLLWLVTGGYFVLLFNQLFVDWSINPQYHYGWAVPLLALASFHLRWPSRPASEQSQGRGLYLVLGLLLAALLPIRLAEESNPEWRLVMWAHAFQTILIALCLIYYAGGWPWIKHFAFPVCFMLVAVPWPVPLEHLLIQDLMRGIAAVTVEMVGLLDIPAAQFGNVIQISTGFVGIDEACSGVRSLQTTLFISLFLGELYRFSMPRRIGLTLGCLGLALAGNVGRTTFLVWSAAREGLERMHQRHDAAGNAALVAILVGSWLLAVLLRGRQRNEPPATTQAVPARSFSHPLLWVMAAWILVVQIATAGWYRLHESPSAPNARWSVNWPSNENRFADTPISDSVRSILRYSSGHAAGWEDSIGNQWQLFLFRWEAGRNSTQLATAHTPDICLTAAGYQLSQDKGVRIIETHGLKLPVRQSVFLLRGEPLHVFYCLWEDHPATDTDAPALEGELSIGGRLRAVGLGRRHRGQQVLEAAIRGPASAEEAVALFEKQIDGLVLRSEEDTSSTSAGNREISATRNE